MKGMRALIVVGLAACLGGFAAPARAGEYVVHACEGASAAGSGWIPSFSGWNSGEGPLFPEPLVEQCGASQSPEFGVNFASTSATGPLAALWRFDAPGYTTIASLVLWRRGEGYAFLAPFTYAVRDASGTALELLSQDNWVVGLPEFSEREFSRLSTSSVSFGLTCPASIVCGGGSQGPSIAANRALVTLRDETLPTSSETGVKADSSGTVDVPFSDRGGGVQSVALLVGGTEIKSREFCHAPFSTPVPCPTDGTARFDGLAPDTSDIEVQLVDAAGNRRTIPSTSSQFPTENAPTPSLVPTAPVNLVPVRGIVGLVGARTLRSRYSKPPVVKGTLKATMGLPLAGVVVTTSDGTSAKTDSKGRFSVKLAKGPSREVRISYGDSVQTVKVIVAAPIRFKANRKSTRNGRSITFTGTVPGAGKARTRVELQALAHGKWIPFKTADLRNGTFKANYRFTRTFFTQRYTFRAVIHEDDGFPYAAGTSSRVRVTVHA